MPHADEILGLAIRPPNQSYSPGSVHILTETGCVFPHQLKLAGIQCLTIEGTGCLVIVG